MLSVSAAPHADSLFILWSEWKQHILVHMLFTFRGYSPKWHYSVTWRRRIVEESHYFCFLCAQKFYFFFLDVPVYYWIGSLSVHARIHTHTRTHAHTHAQTHTHVTSMVGSYSSTKWFWMSWMVRALLPTPPAPTTTSLYSVILFNLSPHLRRNQQHHQ